ncbi:MAG: hypothetical protein Q7J73_01445 [Dehalococcoidales bacterium]|nr:hypothetical protein [Dehalococcoidales bacterium]
MAKLTILCLVLASGLLVGVFGLNYAPAPAAAAPDELQWSPVNIPAEGKNGKWQLAAGSDVDYLAMARDGALYAYANPSGTNYTLFKSVDSGESWSYVGNVTGAIVAIATALDDANAVYYATNSTVYKSSDGGVVFTSLPSNPGGAGSSNISITGLSIDSLNTSRIVAVGTRDRDSTQFGGVYTVNESNLSAGWVDTGIGNYDVLSVAFSPNYATDRQLIAVATDENNTLVSIRNGANGWATVSGNATISGVVPGKATIALPVDYNAVFFLALETGNNSGDVYRIERRLAPASSNATDLNIASADNLTGIDVAGLAVSGNTTTGYNILAGTTNGTRVYTSANSGQNWSRSSKEPTGQSKTRLLMSSNFATSRRAYAATSGAGSAFSYSVDGGLTWNQLSLIDTTITAIVDMAVSPNYAQDSTLFLLTWGGEHSLWRSRDSGVRWERVFTGTLAGATSLTHLELSPQYGANESVVYLAGGASGQWAVWKSGDNGQIFTRRLASFTIDTLTVVNNDNLFLGSYNSTNGLVYSTNNSGVSYSAPSVVGSQPLKSLVLSPGYAQDKTILIGNTNGWVYWSADNATSFEPLPSDAVASPLTGNVFVAFDPLFSQSRIVYAASDTLSTSSSKERIYRFTIGKSRRWESVDSTLPVGSKFTQLSLFRDGTLYAASSMYNGGVERSLNPASSQNIVFETVTWGLTDNATLTGLWALGNQLWSIDTRNSRLMTYIDTLTVPANPASPANRAPGVGNRGTSIEWETLRGATEYEWQIDYDAGFSSLPSVFDGDTKAGSARLPVLDMATTYYWRVRATKPMLSPWSTISSFTTLLGTSGVLPELYSPKAGADVVPVKPVFQWGVVNGAEQYELVVSANASFSNPVIAKVGASALSTTAWQSNISLDYDITYFWKIRGISTNSYSLWSAASAFTIVPPPLPPVAPPPVVVITPELYSPSAGANGVPLKPVFQWSSIVGAERYEMLVSENLSFSNPIIAKTGADSLPATAWQSNISLDYDTTYYWKIRAGGADSWSAIGAFTTVSPPPLPLPPSPTLPSPVPVLPLRAAEIVTPKTGAGGIGIKPIFQWSVVDGAEKYELLVSPDVSFSIPVIVRIGGYALPAAAWHSEIALEYGTTYYWKIRAVGTNNSGDWGTVGIFTTESLPPLPLSPAPPAQPSLPSWVINLGIGLLAVIGLLLVIILVMVISMRNY